MQSRVRGDNATSAARAVGVVRWTDELSFLALLKLGDTLVPASNDLTCTDREVKRLPSLVA